MSVVIFFLAAIGAIAGALGTVLLRNAFFAVLALVGHLLSLAALFLLLRAEFLAAAQVVVYAGAVMVLYVFVVAYVGGIDQPLAGCGHEPARRLDPLRGRPARRVLHRDPRLGRRGARRGGHGLLQRVRHAASRSASCC